MLGNKCLYSLIKTFKIAWKSIELQSMILSILNFILLADFSNEILLNYHHRIMFLSYEDCENRNSATLCYSVFYIFKENNTLLRQIMLRKILMLGVFWTMYWKQKSCGSCSPLYPHHWEKGLTHGGHSLGVVEHDHGRMGGYRNHFHQHLTAWI